MISVFILYLTLFYFVWCCLQCLSYIRKQWFVSKTGCSVAFSVCGLWTADRGADIMLWTAYEILKKMVFDNSMTGKGEFCFSLREIEVIWIFVRWLDV